MQEICVVNLITFRRKFLGLKTELANMFKNRQISGIPSVGIHDEDDGGYVPWQREDIIYIEAKY